VQLEPTGSYIAYIRSIPPNCSVLNKKKIHDTNETKLKQIIGYNISSTKDFLIQA